MLPASPRGVIVRALVLSRFALDGGAMHGIVPRPLWERVHPPDAANRIALVARAALVDHAPSGARTLVELGMGQRWSAKLRERYSLADGRDVPDVLRGAGIDPDTITHVVLTHGHWDHTGGLVLAAPERPTLSLPKAEHIVGEAWLAHAMQPSEKDGGSFRHGDLELLLREGRVRRFRPGEPLAPGLTARISNGHTEGLLVPMVDARDDGPPLAMPTDLVPTRSHLAPSWTMAYDNQPLVSMAEKKALLDDLLRMGGGMLLYHDPDIEAAWARDGRFVPGRLDGSTHA